MGLTIFYKGRLKEPNDLTEIFYIIESISNKYKWPFTMEEEGCCVEIPDCESFIVRPQNGMVNGWVKYWCSDETLVHLYEMLREIRPYFRRLDVHDDYGAWDDYIAKFSKTKQIPFRELKAIEKEELDRWFDLPEGSTSIFPMEQPHAIMMFMLCKDMSDDLSKPMKKVDFEHKIDPRTKGWEIDEPFQFIAIAESWFLNILLDKKGNSPKHTQQWELNALIFAWVMGEIIFGFSGGSLGSKHQKIIRFIDYLQKKGVKLDAPENFLRLIYSLMEYCGGYRPDALITKQG